MRLYDGVSASKRCAEKTRGVVGHRNEEVEFVPDDKGADPGLEVGESVIRGLGRNCGDWAPFKQVFDMRDALRSNLAGLEPQDASCGERGGGEGYVGGACGFVSDDGDAGEADGCGRDGRYEEWALTEFEASAVDADECGVPREGLREA